MNISAILLAFAIMLSGCSANNTVSNATGQDIPDNAIGAKAVTDNAKGADTNNGSALPIPQELETIPEAYYTQAAQQGTLVELSYSTYESKTYAQKTQQLQKRAIVYLPYGYNENQKYNVFYLMHGGGGNETRQLGTPANPSAFKNVIDNAIAAGEFEPLIIVCPTYNNTSSEDSFNFNLALELNRNYHNELLNDLIPAVESTYSTYAESTSPEDLMDSRDHRGFGGFSMGSVATWRIFQSGLDYFQYFLPMSCGTSLDEENIFAAAENHDQSDYFVWVIVGTEDFSYSYDENRVELMRNSSYFTESVDGQSDNFAYHVKEGYSHDGRAAMEYTYNGLRLFWNTEPAQTGLNGSEPYKVGEHIEPSDMIRDIVEHPAFRGYGEKLLPSVGDQNNFDISLNRAAGGSDSNIENITASLNHLIDDAAAGLTIYYDFYSEQERKDDPAKDATGLFFYRGEPGAPFAVIAPGGAFAFVGSFQAGFPYAKEISDAGYNAFMLKYRVGGEQIATEDLAAAISFIFENAEELGVSTDDYSVWGSSAGGRMAANIGTDGPAGYGGDDLPRPATVIMCCTGHSRYSENDPPTFVVVGENDGIASPATMERRVNALKSVGVDTEFRVYPGLGHYFGLGIGTVAEGWLDEAVAFWEKYMNQ